MFGLDDKHGLYWSAGVWTVGGCPVSLRYAPVYTNPWSNMASTTLTNPAILAPLT
jgi:hypothetical protein